MNNIVYSSNPDFMNSRNPLLISGKMATGKTTLARKISEQMGVGKTLFITARYLKKKGFSARSLGLKTDTELIVIEECQDVFPISLIFQYIQHGLPFVEKGSNKTTVVKPRFILITQEDTIWQKMIEMKLFDKVILQRNF